MGLYIPGWICGRFRSLGIVLVVCTVLSGFAGVGQHALASLLRCPDCGHRKVSPHASVCPQCGCPASLLLKNSPTQPTSQTSRSLTAETSVPVLVYDSEERGFLRAEGISWECDAGTLRELLGTLIITPTNYSVHLDFDVSKAITGNKIEIEIHMEKPEEDWNLYSRRARKRYVKEPLPRTPGKPFKLRYTIEEKIWDTHRVGFRIHCPNSKKPLLIKSVKVYNHGSLNRRGGGV